MYKWMWSSIGSITVDEVNIYIYGSVWIKWYCLSITKWLQSATAIHRVTRVIRACVSDECGITADSHQFDKSAFLVYSARKRMQRTEKDGECTPKFTKDAAIKSGVQQQKQIWGCHCHCHCNRQVLPAQLLAAPLKQGEEAWASS